MKRQREENPETKPEPRRSKRQKKNQLQQVPKYFKDPCYTWERNPCTATFLKIINY